MQYKGSFILVCLVLYISVSRIAIDYVGLFHPALLELSIKNLWLNFKQLLKGVSQARYLPSDFAYNTHWFGLTLLLEVSKIFRGSNTFLEVCFFTHLLGLLGILQARDKAAISWGFIPSSCLVTTESMHISPKYSSPIKALVTWQMFPIVLSQGEHILIEVA